MEPSVVVGQKITVRIQDIAFGGEGVARLGELVVFISFVGVGEEVEAEVTELKKNFARARLLQVLTPSAARVQAPCRYFGNCGGCQYQHLDYPEQLRIKHKQVVDLFQRIGHLPNSLIDPVIPCPQPYHYRNRIMIRSQWDKFKQGLNIGFIRYDNRLVEDITECLIAEPALNEQITEVRKNPPPKGGLKVVLRIAPEGWHVPRDSFFQNNFFLLPQFVATVRDRIQAGGSKFLIDAYCGVGFFSIETADLVERFIGVEVDAAAIKSARLNQAQKGIKNGEYRAGRTEEMLPSLLQEMDPAQTTLVLDPPRTGCDKVGLEPLLKNPVNQVIYISCHPATLARDVKLLTESGLYEVVKVVPLDMFPQTQHVECVADLRCRKFDNQVEPVGKE